MRSFLALPVVALLLLSACGAQPPATGDDTGSSSSAPMGDEDSSAFMDDTSSGEAESAMDDDSSAMPVSSAMTDDSAATGEKVVAVTVTNWSFAPNAITAKKGETLTLQLTGDDGVHSLMIPDLGINTAVQPGQTVTVDIPTDKIGTFSFRCGIPCGPGHKDMVGTITIS